MPIIIGSRCCRLIEILSLAAAAALLLGSVGCGSDSSSSGGGNAAADGVRLVRDAAGKVTAVTFQGAEVKDASLAVLKDHPGVQSLTLLNCSSVSDAAMKSIGAQKELTTLTINQTGIGDAGLLMLKPGTLPSLKNLILSDLPVTGEGMAGLSAAPECEELELFRLHIGDQSLKVLSGLSHLKRLSLQSCPNLTGEGLSYLAGLGELKELDLRGTVLTKAGLQQLATLTQLQQVLPAKENLTDEGLKYLGQMTSLRTLQCRDVEITDKGLSFLAAMPNLEELELNRCGSITNEGLIHLATIRSLKRLHLNECPQITDDGMVHLKGVTNLELVSVTDSPVSGAAAKQLKEWIPQSAVFYGVSPGVIRL
ncbi:MAG: hypothetical protein RIK87_19760 [Fuerstiella sp.]